MQSQATAAPGGIVVAHGYGLKVYVERGHLIVHDGIGRNRTTLRLNRATSRLTRLIVIGHTGFITFEAIRWIRDVGATFAQIGTDGTVVALSAAARHHESKLRRAQAVAADNDSGKCVSVALLRAKLLAQAEVVVRLAHLKPTVRIKNAKPVTVAKAILGWRDLLDAELSYSRMREIESSAGRNYWQAWARVAPIFETSFRRTIPEHWLLAGPRTSGIDRKRARKAATPVHAILNYAYAILEVEAAIASHRLGFDPSLGLMHTDQRYRGSLTTDLMEPARPIADGLVLDLLSGEEIRRGDVSENHEGVCRIGPRLAQRIAQTAPLLLAAVAPHAEFLARTLLASPNHATPLTRQRHRDSIGR